MIKTAKKITTNFPLMVIVAVFIVLSWTGEVIHNAVELPMLTLLSPENSLPALVSLILFANWWMLPYKRLGALLLLTWGMLHLVVGAVITVIPFSFLPFVPEQSLRHYSTHVLYGVAQLPLIITMARQMRKPRF